MAMKTKTGVGAALDALEDTLPSLLTSYGVGQDVCVLATRVACLALSEVGLKASPLPCRVQAFSPRYRRALEAGEIEAANGDTDAVARLVAEGAHVVDIGHPDNEGLPRPDGRRGYNAHLVALVERRWVVDLTIQQASRPTKSMVFEPHHFRVTPAFMAGGPITLRTDDYSTLVYVRVDNNTYTVAPDWTNVRRDDRLVRTTAERLRKAI